MPGPLFCASVVKLFPMLVLLAVTKHWVCSATTSGGSTGQSPATLCGAEVRVGKSSSARFVVEQVVLPSKSSLAELFFPGTLMPPLLQRPLNELPSWVILIALQSVLAAYATRGVTPALRPATARADTTTLEKPKTFANDMDTLSVTFTSTRREFPA